LLLAPPRSRGYRSLLIEPADFGIGRPGVARECLRHFDHTIAVIVVHVADRAPHRRYGQGQVIGHRHSVLRSNTLGGKPPRSARTEQDNKA